MCKPIIGQYSAQFCGYALQRRASLYEPRKSDPVQNLYTKIKTGEVVAELLSEKR